MKKHIIILFFLCLAAVCTAQAQSVEDLYTKTEVDIKMRDGVKLRTIIYEPKDKSVKHPVMMERTCYSIAPYGEGSFRNLAAYGPYYEARYIFVFQDVRGKFMSEGEYDDIRPFIENKKLHRKESRNIGNTDEASDTYDTVEWIVKNTNNNGCVGQKGISYPGFYATMGALSGHPAMKAVSPQAPVTDWFHGDDVHHNGAFFQSEMVAFQPFFEYMASNRNVRYAKDGKRPQFYFPELFHNDGYSDFLKIGTYTNITKAYGDSLSYLNTLREHPNWDEYWISHTVTEGHLHDVKPAVMVVGGLFDKEDCYGAFATYKAIKQQSPDTELYLVEGPWYHGAWARGMKEFWDKIYFGKEAVSEYYVNNIEYPFFAYYLEGKGEKPQAGALVFDSGARTWSHYGNNWPLVCREEATPFYLHADGSIGTDAPKEAEAVLGYVSDPAKPVPYRGTIDSRTSLNYMIDDQRFASQRPDVLCFQTETLEQDMSLKGEIEVELMVDISTTDADFIVKVIDVYPDGFSWRQELGIPRDSDIAVPQYVMGGYQMLVRGEVMRGKYRNSFADPQPFQPGETTKVSFTMPDISHTFKAGHKLMIQIQSSWFPLVDRNPQTFCDIYSCGEDAYRKSTVNIHCEAEAPSMVKLPLVK